jgi:hypothetical protein
VNSKILGFFLDHAALKKLNQVLRIEKYELKATYLFIYSIKVLIASLFAQLRLQSHD